MAKFLTIQVQGLRQMKLRLDRLTDDIQEGISDEMLLAALDIQEKATMNIRNSPHNDQGGLLGGMTLVENRADRKVEVGNVMFYSPYIEFGTGMKVNVPAEWRAYALTFQGKAGHGNFDQFVDNLIDWLHRKGITPAQGTTENDYENFAINIAVKILREGQEPHPFLYPAYVQVKKDLLVRIRNLIQTGRT